MARPEGPTHVMYHVAQCVGLKLKGDAVVRSSAVVGGCTFHKVYMIESGSLHQLEIYFHGSAWYRSEQQS